MIPARLGSIRLPRKPLAYLDNKTVIQHVFENALKANIGPVVIATDALEIQQHVENFGGTAIMTSSKLSSGSDRIFHALQEFDRSEKFDTIINLQGDLPIFPTKRLKELIQQSPFDIRTAVMPLAPDCESNPNNVKVALASEKTSCWKKAIYFSRSAIPFGARQFFQHIG